MTADTIAAFAARPGALTYANVCARWGVDPAGALTDDVLAFNLRAALAIRMNEADVEDEPAPDPFDETRKAAEKVRQWQG